MRKTGQDAAGSSILYLLSGFLMGRRNAACVAEDRLVGEGGGTIVGCAGVASVQAVPKAYVDFSETQLIRLKLLRRSSTYLTQMLRDLENLRAPAMPAMKRCFR
jgi:hypothetical protein